MSPELFITNLNSQKMQILVSGVSRGSLGYGSLTSSQTAPFSFPGLFGEQRSIGKFNASEFGGVALGEISD